MSGSAPEPEAAEPVRRWRLDIGYDGADFAGWARQPDRRTVQGVLEDWVGRVLRLPAPAELVCAGRTDAGVHARGQVAHLDLPAAALEDGERLAGRLLRVLPRDVVVRRVAPAPSGFDARFGAVWRRYVYRLSGAGHALDPLLRHQVVEVAARLDVAAMAAAAPLLLGLRDFGAFCKRREGATSVRTLLQLEPARVVGGPADGVVEVTVRADAFCHSMVRSLVGALVEVGCGRRDAHWLREVTVAAARTSTVPVLPAKGLTLEEVGYPADDALAARVVQARSRREVAV